ncbi:MAG: hypothetical protein E7331_12295 [Clostridiales bacterium]|nr:hypothetical protein [Clostridiales bacterium]
MKKMIVVVLLLCLQVFPCFAESIESLPEDWYFVGYTYGGITFPVPDDVEFFELSEQDKANGIILVCFNQDFTLQLRQFAPSDITWDEFTEIMAGESSADVSYLDEAKSILHVKNTSPTANSELVSISMNGLDGNMYKISIFTGMDEDCSAGARVWECAQTVSAYTRYMDFSDWPLQENATSEAD